MRKQRHVTGRKAEHKTRERVGENVETAYCLYTGQVELGQ